MGRSKDLATGETRFANVAGDTFSGNVIHTGTVTANNDVIANKHLRLYTTDDQTNQWYVYNNTDDTLRFNYNGAGNDEVVLDTTGRMTIPNQPSFQAYGASQWQTVTSGNTQVIALNVAASNIGNDYNTSNYRFTAPVAGQYLFSINCYCRLETHDDDSNHAYIFLQKNGVTYINSIAIYGYYNSGDVDQTQNICGLMTMAAGDYATAALNAASGDASAYRGATTFSGFLVG